MNKDEIENATKQILNNYFNVVNNILDVSMQNCVAFGSNSQRMRIVDVRGDVNINNLDWTEWAHLDTQCLQVNAGSEEISKGLNDLAKTIANAIKEKVKKISDKDIDVLREVTNISNTITKIYSDNCMLDIQNTQEIIIENVNKVNISYLKWSQVIDGIVRCIQNNSSVKTDIDALWKAIGIDHSSSTPDDNKYDFIKNYAFIVAVPFVMLLLLLLFPNQHKNPSLYGIFFFLLFLYLSLAKIWNGFPYNLVKKFNVNYIQYIMIALSFLSLFCSISSIIIFKYLY